MYHTTGFTKDEIINLCAMVCSAGQEPGLNHWPPILGLFKSVVVALTYMRRNRVQAELAESYGVSQPTISRAVTGITPLLGKALKKYVPTADQLDERTQYIVDGTLLPCWSWASHPELYSGKHKTTGMNVQVACTLAGTSHGSPTRSRKPALVLRLAFRFAAEFRVQRFVVLAQGRHGGELAGHLAVPGDGWDQQRNGAVLAGCLRPAAARGELRVARHLIKVAQLRVRHSGPLQELRRPFWPQPREHLGHELFERRQVRDPPAVGREPAIRRKRGIG